MTADNKYQMSTNRNSQAPSLWLVQTIITAFRVVFRVQEVFASPRKRERLRKLREKMAAIEADKREVLHRLKNEPGFGSLEFTTLFLERHGDDAETRASLEESRGQLLAMRQVSDELQSIHRQAEGNWEKAAADYRAYLKQHPDARLAYSYLGGALQRTGDFDGSLAAYREALELDNTGPLAAGTRISIGEVLREKGDWAGATAEFYSVINDDAKRSQVFKSLAYYSLGITLAETGDHSGAQKAWKQAIKWDTTKAIAPKAREKIAASR